MGDIGVPELLIVLVIVVAIFGAGKLAGVGAALGSTVREFRQAVRDEAAPGDEGLPSEQPGDASQQ